ncbi:MAG: (deoxy)nucleoside triphosphate pyrophosphohydrolase [Phycisphaeraceae bacterium]|nr:(deoxy)nucleoside triphosphate pyrophosphohydrolase [Phycisphaeraceae bacterium]
MSETGSGQFVEIAIGIVLRPQGESIEVLLSLRRPDADLAGFWEFPGGKIEGNETPSDAATREIREELDIEVEPVAQGEPVDHRYPHRRVRLWPMVCRFISGSCRNLAVSEHRWIPIGGLKEFRFPPANGPILAWIAREGPAWRALLGEDDRGQPRPPANQELDRG